MDTVVFLLGDPNRALRTVPVVPGPEPAAVGPCVACGDRGMRAWKVVSAVDLILCIDAEGCRARFTEGEK
jgi:hypothetical protein